ncbi:MAG: hypothetical protein R8P61_34880 [Bacteroidia bacterium]|nr:hypothetical protein [Bacteroidia bacterium]
MKTLKNLSILAFLLLAFSAISCNQTNNPITCNYAAELQDEATALSNAAAAYGMDQSSANCEAYRQAFMDYLDEAEKLDDCVISSERAAYRQAIDDTQASLDALTC